MEHLADVPFDPEGFTVYELGLRLRHGGETVAWLKQFGLEIDVLRVDQYGTWFELKGAQHL